MARLAGVDEELLRAPKSSRGLAALFPLPWLRPRLAHLFAHLTTATRLTSDSGDPSLPLHGFGAAAAAVLAVAAVGTGGSALFGAGGMPTHGLPRAAPPAAAAVRTAPSVAGHPGHPVRPLALITVAAVPHPWLMAPANARDVGSSVLASVSPPTPVRGAHHGAVKATPSGSARAGGTPSGSARAGGTASSQSANASTSGGSSRSGGIAPRLRSGVGQTVQSAGGTVTKVTSSGAALVGSTPAGASAQGLISQANQVVSKVVGGVGAATKAPSPGAALSGIINKLPLPSPDALLSSLTRTH